MLTALPFQEDDATWLATMRRAANLSEMGVGKSVICATAIHKISLQKKRKLFVLVLGPKSVRFVWHELLIQYLCCIKGYKYINYDKLVQTDNCEKLSKIPWDVIILDESDQCILRWSAKRCINFFNYFQLSGAQIWATTATPAEKSAMDYHPLFTLMEPGVHGEVGEFGEKHCNYEWNIWKKEFEWTGFKDKEGLATAFKRFARRRLKKDVMPELPPKFFTRLPCEIDSAIAYQCIKEKLVENVKTNPETIAQCTESYIQQCVTDKLQMPGHLATVVRAMGLAKVPRAVQYIKESSHSTKNPIVIFIWSNGVAEALFQALNSKTFPVAVFTGKTSDDDRMEIQRDFQANKYGAVILNIAAGGAGITLTAANTVLYVELPWSIRKYKQSQDRVHRYGTTKNVNLIHLIALNTIDEYMYRTLTNKENDVNLIDAIVA